MRAPSPLGPSKRVYLGLALVCLLAAGPAQWMAEWGRRQALGPPRSSKPEAAELLPLVLGGFRGPIIAGLAYYAQDEEIAANIYTTQTSIKTLLKIQPEFEHLWIYYAWVISYNLGAIINTPEEKYQIIRDGADFLEKGIHEIAKLYAVQGACVNDRDPISRLPIDPAHLAADCTRTFVAKTVRGEDLLPAEAVGFADVSGALKWDTLTDDQRALALEAVRSGALEYKRKRATLLFMIGWTYYQKLSQGKEPHDYYRRWFIRDMGGKKDPFQVAYQFLAQASAVDVPPYQVSYEVIKTSPVHCLMDYGRALAEDPKVPTKVVAEVFDRIQAEWKTTLPRVQEPKRVRQSIEEMNFVVEAMRLLAKADEKASVGNLPEADAALAGAQWQLDELLRLQPRGSYQEIYRQRLDIVRERVRKYRTGQPVGT